MKFSFPVKIALGIALVIIIPLVVVVTRWISHGSVRFESTVPGAYVVDEEIGRKDVPVVLSKRTAKYPITLGAPGYKSKEETIAFPSFRAQRTISFTLEKEAFDEDDPNITQKVPLGEILPFSQDGIFDVSFPDTDRVYTVTLQANPNWFDDDAQYRQALKEQKQKALDWFKSKSVDPNTLKIEWIPYDPGTL